MSKGKLLALCLVWLLVAAVLAVAYRTLIYPTVRNRLLSGTGSNSNYRATVDMAIDSFSGYAILRSDKFQEELVRQRIRLNLLDDGANYMARINQLRHGEIQLAAFTIDALLTVSAGLDTVPGTIVAIVDETRGADAIVAYKETVPNIDALNNSEMRFVLTPNSPSETLARVVMSTFSLSNLPARPFVTAQDAEAVYRLYRQAKPETPQVFVLWQPYVSKVLENPNTHVVADSARFRGYIVDVIVANRDFLLKNEDVVHDFVASYFRAVYHYRDNMEQLVMEDARKTGAVLSTRQAEDLVKGIWWKNTQENFAHFALQDGRSLQLLEDMIANISRVLSNTGAVPRDPTGGQPASLYFDRILRELQQSNFHPGLADEQVRDESVELPQLDDQAWEQLVPLGTLAVPDLVFARGTDRLTASSQVVLDDLLKSLQSFPQSYVLIRGNADRRGDLDSNQELARRRAQAAEKYLIDEGIHPNRVRAVGVQPSGRTSVSFLLGQPAY